MIAQFNIARARWDLDDPRMKPFWDSTYRINRLAERSPGYVWRLEDDAEVLDSEFRHEPRLTMTLSVWTDVDSLRHFTWNTLHKKFRLRTREWFEVMEEANLAIWPIPDDHRPNGAEAHEMLKELRRTGPTERVVGTAALQPVKETS